MQLYWYFLRLKKVQGKKKRDVAAREAERENIAAENAAQDQAAAAAEADGETGAGDLLSSKDEDVIFWMCVALPICSIVIHVLMYTVFTIFNPHNTIITTNKIMIGIIQTNSRLPDKHYWRYSEISICMAVCYVLLSFYPRAAIRTV